MEAILNNSVQENLLMSIGEKNEWDNLILEKFLTIHKNFLIKSNSYVTYKTQILKVYNHYKEKNYYATEIEMLKNIDIDSIEKFFIDLKLSEKYKASSYNLIRSANFEFFEYLKNSRHIITINPLDVVNPMSISDVKESKTEKEILTIPEMKEILTALDIREKGERNFEFNSARNKLLYSLLYTTGLRISEILQIKMSWIEKTPYGFMINIPKNIVKNKIDKRVPLVDSIIRYYYDYLAERDSRLNSKQVKTDLLFLSQNLKTINTTDINDGLKKTINKTKIDKHISAHSFRHSLTRNLVLSGCDESIVYKILGWSEKGIISNYSGSASDKIYDEIKHKVCNIL